MNLFLLVENRPESVQDFVGIENFSSSSSVLVGPRLVKLIRAMDLCLESRADRNAFSTMCSSSGLLHPRINTQTVRSPHPPLNRFSFFTPRTGFSPPFRTAQPPTRILPGLELNLEQVMRKRLSLFHIAYMP